MIGGAHITFTLLVHAQLFLPTVRFALELASVTGASTLRKSFCLTVQLQVRGRNP